MATRPRGYPNMDRAHPGLHLMEGVTKDVPEAWRIIRQPNAYAEHEGQLYKRSITSVFQCCRQFRENTSYNSLTFWVAVGMCVNSTTGHLVA